jgi:hypothetical protein
MKFKNWLLNEDGFADAGGNSWDVLYPTYADDYPNVSKHPLKHMWLQFRWDRGLELGRKLINIDNDEFQKRGYTSIESTTAPPAGDNKKWKHKPDDGTKSSMKVVTMDRLPWLADGKSADQTKALEKGTTYRSWTGANGSLRYEPDYDLDSIFHDEPEHKWPEIDEKYMDAPFKKQYEHAFAQFVKSEYTGVGTPTDLATVGSLTNANIKGIKSKYGADESGPEKEKPKTADFGFERRPREKPRLSAIDKKKGRLLRLNRPDMA